MTGFRVMFALLAAFSASVTPARGAEPASAVPASAGKTFYNLSANGAIQIGLDGHVSDYRVEGDLSPAVAALVQRAVMGWQFEPILVDGKPVVAKTAMRLDLHAEPVAGKDDEFSVSIQRISFGNPVRRGIGKAPRYPEAAARARLGAYVTLAARLDENGRIAEVYPYQTSLDAHADSEKQAEKWRRQFEKAAIKAAKTWQYDLTEMVGGRPIGGYASIPVHFFMSNTRSPDNNDWHGFEAGPIHPAPWTSSQNQALVAQSGNDAVSTSSRFHLKDDVIGKAL